MQVHRSRMPRMLAAAICAFVAIGLAPLPGTGRTFETQAFGRPSDAEIESAIDRGAKFLKKLDNNVVGSHGLVCYALLNAGVPVDDPAVSSLLRKIKGKVRNGAYSPEGHHYYEGGVDLMALEKADATLFKPEIEAIALYIAQGQLGTGTWYYPEQRRSSGDTSITQYSVLGLWAAARGGVKIPNNVWDRMAAWLVSTQMETGAFTYHPPENQYGSLHAMTVAGVACLYVAKQYLDPSGKVPEPATPTPVEKKEAKPEPVFGVLEEVVVDEQEKDSGARPQTSSVIPSGPSKRTVENAKIDEAIGRGVDWLGRNYPRQYQNIDWPQYYLYGLERMTALGNMTEINGHDWYGEGADMFVSTQQSDGHWHGNSSQGVITSFAILFLSRATGQLLKRAEPGQPPVGGGLLAGGRGLPENLAEVQLQGGDVKTQKLTGPVADMLASLENPQSTSVIDAQQALVEKIQVGDREELIGQTERLLRLLDDSRVEVRRTALWALGRTGDIRLVPKIIRGLNDPSVDVAVEARNALCWISRRPNGFGLTDSPLDSVSEDASEDQQQQAIQKWRAEAVKRWTEWYASIRPYNERDDSLEAGESE